MSKIKAFFGPDRIMVLVFLVLAAALYILPTGYEERIDANAVRCRGLVTRVDNSRVQQMGIVRVGGQNLTLKLLDGPHKGESVDAVNELLGKMELDKMFAVGDVALVILTQDDKGNIEFANPQDHYRLRLEFILFALFGALLLIYGRTTGAKALLSFVFAALMLWKVLIPSFLKGYDPVLVALAVVSLLTAVIIFLVAGLTRKGLVAFLGSMAGVLTACLLAWIFTDVFKLHGAVKPFSETLLYMGYENLDLRRIFVAAVFIASAGAMMDVSMDVAASLDEIACKTPGIGRRELAASGMRVGRAVVGTMTTTLLFAYSGSYITLMMVFMAQGVPLANLFNLIYVSAEILNTLVGSFGLVVVAPFTAWIGALLFGVGAPVDNRGVCRDEPLGHMALALAGLGEHSGNDRLRSYEVRASTFSLRVGDMVDPETGIGLDRETGQAVKAGQSGMIQGVALKADHQSLLVSVAVKAI